MEPSFSVAGHSRVGVSLVQILVDRLIAEGGVCQAHNPQYVATQLACQVANPCTCP